MSFFSPVRARSALALGAFALVLSCARPPRPAALAQADQVRGAPAVKQAAAYAPQMIAHAESLRSQADKAYERGDIATAGILAERALVAYDRAAVIARIAQAEKTAARAEQDLLDAAREQRVLDAEKQRLEADIASIEQLIKVVRDAQPITPTAPADPSRELARLKAARSIIIDARLLCAAAEMLNRPLEGLEQAKAEVARLEDLLVKWPRPAPIDETLRARSQCLSLLTLARRADANAATADAVLAALSSHPDLDPLRDDRGIVVTLRGDATRDASIKSKLDVVAAVAAKYPRFPLLVVSHTRAKPSRDTVSQARARADAAADALQAAGVDPARIRKEHAGPHRPVVHDPLPPPRNSKNDRVEVVLVAPNG